jgi:hypothetical protein
LETAATLACRIKARLLRQGRQERETDLRRLTDLGRGPEFRLPGWEAAK